MCWFPMLVAEFLIGHPPPWRPIMLVGFVVSLFSLGFLIAWRG